MDYLLFALLAAFWGGSFVAIKFVVRDLPPIFGAMLRVAQIPTTIVLNRDGQIYSRMAGFIPERFIDMLKSRIEETLHEQ